MKKALNSLKTLDHYTICVKENGKSMPISTCKMLETRLKDDNCAKLA